MADSFDPYHKWLGIGPKDQPPNHYRLLAIELFEDDLEVIEGAADRQMAHVRTFQAGQNSALSQRILNELSAARLCLLNPQQKAEYDHQLREKIAAPASGEQAASGIPPVAQPPSAVPGELRRPQSQPTPSSNPAPAPQTAAMPVARPVRQAVPPVATPAMPVIVAGEGEASSSSHRRTARKAPLWRQPALLGAAGALIAFAAIGYALTRGDKPATEVAANSTASAPPAGDDKPAGRVGDQSKQPPIDPTTAQTAEPGRKADELPAEKIVASQADAETADFEIVEATWGGGDQWVNVTEAVRALVRDNRLMTMAWGSLYGSPQDPAPGVAKKLRIRYRCRGKQYTTEYYEFWFVYLDGNPPAPPIESPGTLELLEARYGAAKTYVDVLPLLRERLVDGRLTVAADEFAEATAAELEKNGVGGGIFKLLWVRYRNHTGDHFTYAWNSDLVVLDSQPPAPAGPPVDLLKLIDLKRDVVQGAWDIRDGVLHAPGTMSARLQIPYDPPDEYLLTVVAEGAGAPAGGALEGRDLRDGELRDIGAVLVVGGHQVMGVVDGYLGNRSSLQLVNGILLSDENRTCRWRCARMLEQGRENTLTYIVRPGSVRVLRDDAELIRWSGDPRTLSIADSWKIPDDKRLSLQAYDTPFRVKKLALVPLKPEKSPMIVAGGSSAPLDALAAIDIDRDRLHGDWQFDGHSLVSPDSDRAKLQLPVIVPEHYQLKVVAQRESGGDCLKLTVPIAGVPATVVVDGYGGKLSGLQTIDGKTIDTNETKHEGAIFADGKPHSINIDVRKNRFRLYCDAKQLVDWTGDVSRLKSSDSVPYNDRIYVGDRHSRYRLTTIAVRAISADSPDDEPPAMAAGPFPPFAGMPPPGPTRIGPPQTGPTRTPPPAPQVAGSAPAEEKTRLPVPDAEAQKEARKAMQKKFGSAIKAARTPEQKQELAKELAAKAAGKQAGSDAYSLLKQAIDLAEAAGEIDLAWQTIDQLAETFPVNRMTLRSQSLVDVGKMVKSADGGRRLTDMACRLMVEALTAGDAAALKDAAAQAQRFAKRTNDRAVQKEVSRRATDAGTLAADIELVAEARETLKNSPDDPAANFTVGYFELCAAGDFGAALPKLAKSGDAAWQKLASDDLALKDEQPSDGRRFVNRRRISRGEPADAERQLAVADAWWSRADDAPWPGMHHLRMRAAKWYVAAYRSLVDVGRTRADERLKVLLATDDGFQHWELFNWRNLQSRPPASEVARLDRRGGLETSVEFSGPLEATLVVRTTGTALQFSSHNSGWGWNFKVSPNQWHTARFVITPVSQTAFVDGIVVQNETSQNPRTLRSAPVYITAGGDDIVEIKKFIVSGS